MIVGVFLVAGNTGVEFTHMAPHISRVTEIFQEHALHEKYSFANVFEMEVRDGAIRTTFAWFYDYSKHVWVRFQDTSEGKQLSYRFERDTDNTSKDIWLVSPKEELPA